MTKEKFPAPKGWINIQGCEIIYKAFKERAPSFGIEPPSYSFSNAYSNTLQGILGSVALRAKLTNQDVVEVAVSYFVKIAKSQAFFDGNKRMAIFIMGVYLFSNNYLLSTSPKKMIEIAVMLVEDKNISIDEAVGLLTPVFKEVVEKHKPKK